MIRHLILGMGLVVIPAIGFASCESEGRQAVEAAGRYAGILSQGCGRGYLTAISKRGAGDVFYVTVLCARPVYVRVQIDPTRGRCEVGDLATARPSDPGEGYCQGMYGRPPCFRPQPYYGPQP